ncbi:uncharacterized protein Hap1MRO34_008195 [Clarias gariepinus]|uniref:uncharacterized protein si:dkey-195m11.11 n=1 Tax=Clarias gariepinus TaxID=13013 RepID=UPI00234D6AE1|nr:uncharacterized protein si:dkey-195m11.11 [Clarias gariepinus]
MTLHQLTVLCVVVFALQLVESQELLPAPTFVFDVGVNQSAIKLYSAVKVVCTLPNGAKTPAEVHLSQANALNNSSSVLSFTLRSDNTVVFTLNAEPESETAFVCWYRDIQTAAQSRFSSPISIVISALLDPIIILNPPLFAVGGNYSVHIYIPNDDYTNATLILYFRLASNKSFEILGSRVVGPGEQGGVVKITKATVTYEFLSEMEMFFNGRTLRSKSKSVTAMPEALQVHLGPKGSGSDSCYGDAYVEVSGNWASICFSSIDSNGFSMAGVICRELGCGRAIDFTEVSYTSYSGVGTNCTGSEKKIAECPLISTNLCNKGTRDIICSKALPPPKLSVENYDAASRVYVRSTEDVHLECIFHSPRHEFVYITFTHNGNDLSYSGLSVLPGYSRTWLLRAPVPEGEYACYVHPQSNKIPKTENSNVIGIYVYDPPPPGAIAAGVITTVLGVIILVLLCVFGGC